MKISRSRLSHRWVCDNFSVSSYLKITFRASRVKLAIRLSSQPHGMVFHTPGGKKKDKTCRGRENLVTKIDIRAPSPNIAKLGSDRENCAFRLWVNPSTGLASLSPKTRPSSKTSQASAYLAARLEFHDFCQQLANVLIAQIPCSRRLYD